ncbi:MAG: TlpA disulfide reductase family protein [Opitutaceae bacterium]
MKLLSYSGLAVMVLMVAACGRSEPPTGPVPPLLARSALPVLGKAPDWKLKDVDGHEVKASDFKGKVVVIDFWATWCPPCRKEIPDYITWQKKYADRGLVILGFSVDELTPAEVKAFGVKMKMNYPILMADGDDAGAFGGVQALPTAFVIDREGNIRYTKVGLTDSEAYEKLIASLL